MLEVQLCFCTDWPAFSMPCIKPHGWDDSPGIAVVSLSMPNHTTDLLLCGDMQYVHHLPECMTVQELQECASAWRTGPSCLGLVCSLAHVQSHGYAHMLHLSRHVTPYHR